MASTKPALAAAARAAFTAIQGDAPGDHFYFFALYTTEDGSYVGATAWSEEALERVVAASKTKDRRSRDELVRALRFSAPDSPFHDTHDEGFAALRAGKTLHRACFDALRELDQTGFFGRGRKRALVLVNVVYGEMSDERWLDHARQLNPGAAIERVLPFLRLNVASGRVDAWGAKAYQVTALSLSASRAHLAYSGSGGEVGVLDVAKRRPIFERKRAGEHWACAVAPDGSRLYLGDKDAIVVLDPKKGTTAPFAKTGKPSELVLTPDGSLLAASSFDSPLRVFDTTSGKKLWEDKAIKKAALAFSPDGKWLAVVLTRPEKGASNGSLVCVEASSGRVRWSSSLGPTYKLCIAWSGDGTDLLVASSQWTGMGVDPRGAGSLGFVASANGARGPKRRPLAWNYPVDAVALSPSGGRIAVCSNKALAILDRAGSELARGTGTQEHLVCCAFLDEGAVVAAGRDVNRGPALLTLAMG